MRYVVLGAGGIGGTIGGCLFEQGHHVSLVARGPHLAAVRDRGLELRTPDGTSVLPVPAVGDVGELDLGEGDVILLATKTQDTADALDRLAAVAPDVTVVCAQNGVENERLALRLFAHVHGMCVNLPASHLEPGVVECYSTPKRGILDVGGYPDGVDATDVRLAADLVGAGFLSDAVPDVMARKYGKLLLNLGNVMEAAVGSRDTGDIYPRARAEAEICYAAAGIRAVTDVDPRREQMRMARVDGQRRGGGSTWQSLARGSGSTEADHLNGEIVLLGRQHGVPTPVNDGLQRLARRLATGRSAPGSLTPDELAAAVVSRDAGPG